MSEQENIKTENQQESTTPKVDDYNSGSGIKVLRGLKGVIVRPGMYIGDTNTKGLHHMIWEIVDNSIDECMAGYATRVIVTMTKEGTIRVDDDGRGIPTKVNPDDEYKRTGVELALCELHAGGKFDGSAYKISGGLHGVGASVVNALSKWMKVWVNRDQKIYYLEFNSEDWYHNPEGSHPQALALQEVTTTPGETPDVKPHGTIIEFIPNYNVMEKYNWDREIITARLKQLAYLNKGVKIILIDEYTNKDEPTTDTWLFEGGIKEYVLEINKEKEKLLPTVVYGESEQELKAPDESGRKFMVKVEIAFQYTKTYTSSLYSFCNNIYTTEGGTHEEGFKLALVRLINKFAIEKKLAKEQDSKITKEDILEGLTAIISIKHPNPQYKGQTKGELGNSEVRPFVNEVTSNIFEKYLLENPEEANTIIKKIIFAKEARIKSLEAREATRRKSPFDSGSLPGKLSDCVSKDSSISEIYIVEGDSAGGSAKMGRNAFFQAVLPLRGKILNVEKARTEKIFENAEINAMINAFGAGVDPEFDVTKIRYDRIIIMTDADVDGAHIRILLLTFFFRYMKKLVEEGHVYAAVPPLFKIFTGKESALCYTEEELETLKATQFKDKKFSIQRYKGLGEMDPEQLWSTTMDPETRTLKRITIEDAVLADQQFTFLMGDDVEPRKDFITKNAKFVKNIDA